MELVELQERLDSFKERDVRIVASSVDPVDKLRLMREMSGATFEFLSDAEGQLLDLLRVRHSGGRADGADIAQSASFLIDPDGRILWSHVAETYRTRPRPAKILEEIDRRLPGP
ncbi:MAG: redoxin domain-containing protein [Acidobacteriota bacterium]